MKYTYMQEAGSAGPLLAGEIYAYEEPKAGSVAGVCLILKRNTITVSILLLIRQIREVVPALRPAMMSLYIVIINIS